ncbi:hypothetical protein [Isoptericola haloaureus]|uniref:DUF4439 domain-containing protein n=1 Tax=Isoptericola haloaureus TaxID=1542902 RepID=A0ABU7Z7J0_9MICO
MVHPAPPTGDGAHRLHTAGLVAVLVVSLLGLPGDAVTSTGPASQASAPAPRQAPEDRTASAPADPEPTPQPTPTAGRWLPCPRPAQALSALEHVSVTTSRALVARHDALVDLLADTAYWRTLEARHRARAGHPSAGDAGRERTARTAGFWTAVRRGTLHADGDPLDRYLHGRGVAGPDAGRLSPRLGARYAAVHDDLEATLREGLRRGGDRTDFADAVALRDLSHRVAVADRVARVRSVLSVDAALGNPTALGDAVCGWYREARSYADRYAATWAGGADAAGSPAGDLMASGTRQGGSLTNRNRTRTSSIGTAKVEPCSVQTSGTRKSTPDPSTSSRSPR